MEIKKNISILSLFLMPSLVYFSEAKEYIFPLWEGPLLRLEDSQFTYDGIDTLRLPLLDDLEGHLIVNIPAADTLHSRIKLTYIDSTGNEDNLPVLIELSPDGRTITMIGKDQPLSWSLLGSDSCRVSIPAGYFEFIPHLEEVTEMPYPIDTLLDLRIPGYFHKAGDPWNGPALLTIHDDDGVDFKIPSSGAPGVPDRNGYFSILYPLLESLGIRGCLSAEGKRIGMTSEPPAINDNGRIMLRLQNERGWEVMSHSMEVLGEHLNNWVVDSLTSEYALRLLSSHEYMGNGAECPSVYDLQTQRQYFPAPGNEEWIEASAREIKPYAADPESGRVRMYVPSHDVDYHWGEWFRLADEFGFRSKVWVQHNAIGSHQYSSAVNGISPYGFCDMVPPDQYNLPPVRSTLTRLMMEGQSAPNYKGEGTDDNTWDDEQYEFFKYWIDRAVEHKGWLVMGLHAYRKCWRNYLPGSLVSEGGDYPDEWVDPLATMDFLNDPLTPPEALGISEWNEWYPCPGSRLDMLREILRYALDSGMINVTSTEGFDLMGNTLAEGYYNGGSRIGMDHMHLIDDREIYPHYVVGANGEESYYMPWHSDSISFGFRIREPLRDPEDITVGVFRIKNGGRGENATDPWKEDADWLEYTGDEAPAAPPMLMNLDGTTIRKGYEKSISLAGLPSGILLAVIHLENGKSIYRKILR